VGPRLSVVIPTYNEAANVAPLLRALDHALAGVPCEYVVVDDDSKDGTAAAARAASPNARVIVRTTERGLATAVVRGIKESAGQFVAVMDADFQHPPEVVRALLDRAQAAGSDLVVGSRYAEGGSEAGFALHRRIVSRGARLIAKTLLPPVRKFHLTDPMSGLFLFRRDRVDANQLRPSGYKILLEVLERGDLRTVSEVGYKFGGRRGGESKLGASVMLQYVLHALSLAIVDPENVRLLKFLLVGATGVLVNLGVLEALTGFLNLETHVATVLAIEASILSNFFLNDNFTFSDLRDEPFLGRLGLFHLVSFWAAIANFAVASFLHDFLGVPLLIAVAFGILAGLIPNFVGNRKLTYGKGIRPPLRRWLPIAILVLLAGGMYFGALDDIHFLEFDESYYITAAHQFDSGIWADPCHTGGETKTAPVIGIPITDVYWPINYEHPPLGKMIFAASIHAYETYKTPFVACRDTDNGHGQQAQWEKFKSDLESQGNPYAWRGPSALFGVLTVLCVALASRRIFRSDAAGFLAGSFALMDNLLLSSSRLGTLDILATGFVAMAVYAATFPTRRGVVLAALFLGLGFSTKYYVLFAGPPVLFLSLWMNYRAGRLRRRRFDLHLLAYPLIPLGVWIASYWPWWVIWIRAKGIGWAVIQWLAVQGAAFGWDTGYATDAWQHHEYESGPIAWLAMMKPVSYAGPVNPNNNTVGGYIYAIGNPIMWWGAFGAVAAAIAVFLVGYLVSLRRRLGGPLSYFASLARNRQALLVASLLPLITYAGFFVLNRTQYLFYMTVVVPLMAIVLGGAAAILWRRPERWARPAVMAVFALAALSFLWYLPITVSIPIPREGFQWLSVDPGGPLEWLHYPAFGFYTIFHAVPWMHPFGNYDCWSTSVTGAGQACS
jgi:dolichol-phosphate mannosyltransferase